ncbi:MAG: hypothetical protein IIC82_07185, partial [Chloroflexi bacterium]|nr:hypothetical protein [Chloroflexota bacterium]
LVGCEDNAGVAADDGRRDLRDEADQRGAFDADPDAAILDERPVAAAGVGNLVAAIALRSFRRPKE